MSQLEQFRQTYREEASELLTELEEALLELADNLADADVVGRVFRALHTIKGSGAMFGFDAIAGFTHEIETTYDRIRSGELAANPALVQVTLEARDLIRAMLDAPVEGSPALTGDGRAILDRLAAASRGAATPPPLPPSAILARPVAAPTRTASALSTWRIRFAPEPDILQNGTNPFALLAELEDLGRCRAVAHTRNIPRLTDFDPERCYTHWDIIITTEATEDTLRGVFLFVEEQARIEIRRVADHEVLDDAGYRRLGEILVDRGDLTPEQVSGVLQQQKKVGALLEEAGAVPGEIIEAALIEQQEVRQTQRAKSEAQDSASSIRVAASKLDILVDLVGELVIAQARLSQIASRHPVDGLESLAEEIERLTAELRDSTLGIRMLPIGTTFGRFRRLVHDLARDLGKSITLVTEGAETELDKTVIERLGDPLVHIIRNSIDHGIESPAERTAAGKPREGTVHLAAYHSGPNVFIEIKDDGRGLDTDAIRAKAIDRGLIAADAKLSDKELFSLIFLPGFSTAKAVTSVSGRGVGMDVVRRAIENLRGTVDIDSARGVGTTIRVKLPLTLAIIEGLLVAVGHDAFVLPLSLVEECIELVGRDVEYARGQRLVPVRGEQIPYVRLREWFAVSGDHPPIEQVVIANVDGMRFGFAVDGVIGQHQTVIKTLGKAYRDVEGLSGATILGDGTVALILDAPRLVQAISSSDWRGIASDNHTRR